MRSKSEISSGQAFLITGTNSKARPRDRHRQTDFKPEQDSKPEQLRCGALGHPKIEKFYSAGSGRIGLRTMVPIGNDRINDKIKIVRRQVARFLYTIGAADMEVGEMKWPKIYAPQKNDPVEPRRIMLRSPISTIIGLPQFVPAC